MCVSQTLVDSRHLDPAQNVYTKYRVTSVMQAQNLAVSLSTNFPVPLNSDGAVRMLFCITISYTEEPSPPAWKCSGVKSFMQVKLV